MLVLRLAAIDVLMGKRGIKTRKELAVRMGILPTHLTSALKGRAGRHGPGAKVIDRLCTVLRCQPGDFLEHVDSGHDLT
jgi:DNA-binding Xre family transcriptional regulator